MISTLYNKINNKKIVDAIADAEKSTSGEIRVHITKKLKKNAYNDAISVFTQIGMHKTENRNGVLIYIAEKNRKFAIIGDKGVDDVIENDFWEKEKQSLSENFKQEKYTEGLCKVIENVGKVLKIYFPAKKINPNELPDDISYD